MAITIKTREEIKTMRFGGKILAGILDEISNLIEPGVTTKDIDDLANALCKKNKVKPAFNGYHGFPATVCTGIDDVAVHGIPSKDDVLIKGQIVSVDMGIIYHDFYADSARTFAVSTIDEESQKLLSVTQLALQSAINQAVAGNRVGDISSAIEQVALMSGFNVIKDMTGHGIGSALHEEPAIPCFGDPNTGAVLRSGMTLAIEPMINIGESEIYVSQDNWTTKTVDGSKSAIFEHTILVGDNKAEILTIN